MPYYVTGICDLWRHAYSNIYERQHRTNDDLILYCRMAIEWWPVGEEGCSTYWYRCDNSASSVGLSVPWGWEALVAPLSVGVKALAGWLSLCSVTKPLGTLFPLNPPNLLLMATSASTVRAPSKDVRGETSTSPFGADILHCCCLLIHSWQPLSGWGTHLFFFCRHCSHYIGSASDWLEKERCSWQETW